MIFREKLLLIKIIYILIKKLNIIYYILILNSNTKKISMKVKNKLPNYWLNFNL